MRKTWIAVVLLTLAACSSTPTPPQEDRAAADAALREEAPRATATTAPTAPAAAPADEPRAPETLYAVRFLPGAKWVAGKGPMEQPGIGEHAAHMGALLQRKVLWCGGPFLDGAGGLAVFRAASLEEAKRIASEDPGVASGLLVPEVHPWLVVMRADR